jgi:hypothetical protein
MLCCYKGVQERLHEITSHRHVPLHTVLYNTHHKQKRVALNATKSRKQ